MRAVLNWVASSDDSMPEIGQFGMTMLLHGWKDNVVTGAVAPEEAGGSVARVRQRADGLFVHNVSQQQHRSCYIQGDQHNDSDDRPVLATFTSVYKQAYLWQHQPT
jgi:hypothetical protein